MVGLLHAKQFTDVTLVANHTIHGTFQAYPCLPIPQVDRLSSLPADVLRNLCRILSTHDTTYPSNPDHGLVTHNTVLKSNNTVLKRGNTFAFQALRSCCKRLAAVSDEIRTSVLCHYFVLDKVGPFLRKLPHMESVSIGFNSIQNTNVCEKLLFLYSILPSLESLKLLGNGGGNPLLKGSPHFSVFPVFTCICNLEGVDLALLLWNKTMRHLDLSNITCTYNSTRPSCGLAFLSELTALQSLRLHDFYPIMGPWELSGCTGLLKLDLSAGVGGRHGRYLDLDVSVLPLLQVLLCASFKFKSLCVKGLKHLRLLDFTANSIPVIDLSACSALEELRCEDNLLEALDLTACHELVFLACGSSSEPSETVMSNLQLVGCTLLKYLHCSKLNTVQLDLSTCTALQYLHMNVCFVCTLNLADVVRCLRKLSIPKCQLTSLDVSECTFLEELHCGSSTDLVSIVVAGCSKLRILDLFGCIQLRCLNLNGCTSLQNLNCQGCPLNFLDLSSCVSLVALTCSQTRIRYLNMTPAARTLRRALCTMCPNLRVLSAKGCWQLATLFYDGCPVEQVNVEGCTALIGCAVSSSGMLQGAATVHPACRPGGHY